MSTLLSAEANQTKTSFTGPPIDGSVVGPLGITAEQMTDEMFEYIFANGPYPSHAPISQDKLNILKSEFSYFYPMDIRSSGKDLIPNHLTFCIYVHAALFSEDNWPRSMRANGHLMLNGEKMSKSTGNSLTLRDSLVKFGADATRVTLADAGDSIEDANFEESTANAAILRLRTLIEWCEVSQTFSLSSSLSIKLTHFSGYRKSRRTKDNSEEAKLTFFGTRSSKTKSTKLSRNLTKLTTSEFLLLYDN